MLNKNSLKELDKKKLKKKLKNLLSQMNFFFYFLTSLILFLKSNQMF